MTTKTDPHTDSEDEQDEPLSDAFRMVLDLAERDLRSRGDVSKIDLWTYTFGQAGSWRLVLNLTSEPIEHQREGKFCGSGLSKVVVDPGRCVLLYRSWMGSVITTNGVVPVMISADQTKRRIDSELHRLENDYM